MPAEHTKFFSELKPETHTDTHIYRKNDQESMNRSQNDFFFCCFLC